MRIHYLIFILICIGRAAFAQVFPIQVNTQLLPPYSPYLTDYSAPGSQKLMVQLRANDLALSDYNVKLRITIEGVNITIRTKPSFVPQPIVMQGGGIPQIYYGEDLIEYFNPNALDFAGISQSQYERGAKLPEGVYRFTIEVLDYNRNTVVSNKGMTMAWIILNDPPILNLPRKDNKVQVIDPTNIPFTWTPRHTGSPNAAFSTEYVFRIVEIWPLNRNPYDAFLSQQPLYEEVTNQSQLIYGPAHPALIPGRKYAWQVQAREAEGKDLFKNQGRSEVFVFQFGDEVRMPENFRKEAESGSTLSLRWEPSANGEMPDQYRIRYKPQLSDTWYETVTEQRWATLSYLSPDTQYEVQIRAEKANQHSEYTPSQRLSTTAQTANEFTCGVEGNIATPGQPLPNMKLTPGDVFKSRNFRFVVTSVKNVNGIFEGEALMAIPWFSGASVRVRFNGVQLDSANEMVSGIYKSTYNQGSPLSQVIDEMHKIGEKKEQPQAQPANETTPAPDYTHPAVITSVTINAEGQIVVLDEAGNETTYERKKDGTTGEIKETVIADSGGNTYVVDRDGSVTKSNSTLASSNSNAINVQNTQYIKLLALEVIKSFRKDLAEHLNVPLSERRLGAGPMYDIFASDLPNSILAFKDDQYALRAIFDYAGEYETNNELQQELLNIIENDQTLNEIIDKNKEVFKNNTSNFKDHLSTGDWGKLTEWFGSVIIERSLKEFLKDFLKNLDVAAECFDRGLARGVNEFKKTPDFSWALFTTSLEAGLCFTEKDKCANLDNSAKFSYGLTNGILQQLDLPEMRDALIDLIKSTSGNKLKCLLNVKETIKKLSASKDPKEIIKILTGCIYGVPVDVDEVSSQFNLIWAYVKTNYTESYFQGQAAAFIVTIVLPPVIKAIQSIKFVQVLKNLRASLLAKLKKIPDLKGLDGVFDDVARGIKIYRNVPLDDFVKTVPEFANGANRSFAEKAYQLWGEEKWDELYKMFSENNFNGKWPPNNGTIGVYKVESGNQLAGKVFDRFQGKGELSGTFASPIKSGEGISDLYFTYDSRSLKYNISEETQYIKFKFNNNVPADVKFGYGEVIPWWGKPGLGDQIESSHKLLDLQKNGIIEVVERWEFSGGKWTRIK